MMRCKKKSNSCLLLPIGLVVVLIITIKSTKHLQTETLGLLAGRYRAANLTTDSNIYYEELETNYLIPKDVYYFRCGPSRHFEFRHYLSVLSVFTYLKPYRVRFFYENEPTIERYGHDTWLQEIREQYPYFSTEKLSPEWCANGTARKNTEKYLDETGGIFVREDVILARSFRDQQYRNFNQVAVIEDGTNITLLQMSRRKTDVDASTNTNCINSIRSIMFVQSSWELWEQENIQNSRATVLTNACSQLNNTTLPVNTGMLILVTTPLFPEQIWELDTETGRQLRSVAYGKPDLARPLQDFTRLAPNIAHVVWTNNDPMGFHFYLCVLSLLDVAKVDHLYIHGDSHPTGMYWDLIKDHPRLRLIKRTVIDGKSERIYGNTVKDRSHVTDVIRLDILNRYGGLYVDTDAIFLRPLTPGIRAYDAVVSPDVGDQSGLPDRAGFPDIFQNGIMLGKAGAEFWRLMIESNKEYNDDDWLWNSGVNIYRVKERHPTTVLSEPRLNTICNRGKCYPTWERRLRSSTDEDLAEVMKNWRNSTYAVHHTYGPLPELASHTALLENNGATLMGDIGLYVLNKSGMLDYFKRF